MNSLSLSLLYWSLWHLAYSFHPSPTPLKRRGLPWNTLMFQLCGLQTFQFNQCFSGLHIGPCTIHFVSPHCGHNCLCLQTQSPKKSSLFQFPGNITTINPLILLPPVSPAFHWFRFLAQNLDTFTNIPNTPCLFSHNHPWLLSSSHPLHPTNHQTLVSSKLHCPPLSRSPLHCCPGQWQTFYCASASTHSSVISSPT